MLAAWLSKLVQPLGTRRRWTTRRTWRHLENLKNLKEFGARTLKNCTFNLHSRTLHLCTIPLQGAHICTLHLSLSVGCKPTGEKKPKPVMPRPKMLPPSIDQVNNLQSRKIDQKVKIKFYICQNKESYILEIFWILGFWPPLENHLPDGLGR